VYFSGKRVNVSEFDSCQEMSEKKSCHGKLSIAYYKCGATLVFIRLFRLYIAA